MKAIDCLGGKWSKVSRLLRGTATTLDETSSLSRRSLHLQDCDVRCLFHFLFVRDYRPNWSNMASSQKRPVFSRQQVEQYFDRLKIATGRRNYDVAELTPEDTYQYLALLQKHQLVEVPFENLTLHYSPHRQISLHPDELFRKVIGDNNGRGGYCMENNCLFGILLYTLGFQLYPAGARVFDNGVWTGW